MLDRRLGLKAIIAVLVVAVAAVAGISQLIAKDPEAPADGSAAATAVPTACVETADAYGTAPDGFTYEKVDEAARAKTVKALNLNESGGPVDMRAARREGLTLGTLVGIPSQNPAAYVSELVQTAKSGGAPVKKKQGYTVIPLTSGSVFAVGVRGCHAVLISAKDPQAVPFLADAVFAAPAG